MNRATYGNRGVLLLNRLGYEVRPYTGGGRGGGRRAATAPAAGTLTNQAPPAGGAAPATAGRGQGGGRGGQQGQAAAAGTSAAATPIEAKRFRDPQGRSEAPETEFAYATRRHVRNFLDSVKSRQPSTCPMETGFAASLPCLLANVAIREERTVKWDGNKII